MLGGRGETGSGLTNCVEGGEVDCRAEAGSEGRGHGTAPETGAGGTDLGDGGPQRVRA